AGDFVSNKSYFRKYDPANGRMIPEEEWMIYPDTHEAYISHEAFQALKEHLKTQTEKRNRCIKRNRRQIENPDNPFSTILFCGECGRPMRLMKTGDQDGQKYYKCSGVANRTHVGHPPFRMEFGKLKTTLIVKVVVSKNIYFLFLQVIKYCSVPDVSINKLSTFIGNHVRNRILPDHHHFE
ncbi:MAG: recombinase zinc beta ribbon domain-containing protein, partial [Fusicatenibacter saccharivorans]|nr:recombinase zinc beta ribbon domain-containing protein [Fusicatenibacter saccharivorans]